MEPNVRIVGDTRPEHIHIHRFAQELELVDHLLQRRTHELEALYETSLALMQGQHIDEVLHILLNHAGELTDADHGYVALVEPDATTIKFSATMGLFKDVTGACIHHTDAGLIGRVWQSAQAQRINDYDIWPGGLPALRAAGVRASVAVPLVNETRVVGVLGLAHTERGQFFDGDSAELLQRFAPLATIALHNAQQYTQMQRELEERRRAEEIIRFQTEELNQLSTPLIPITDDIVVMPLIGSIDARRSDQMIENLLYGIQEHSTRVAILDITGISVVDAYVARLLMRAAQSVSLLGARVILTGMRPDTAHMLVTLGVDLGGIATYSTLQRGIAHAMGRKLR